MKWFGFDYIQIHVLMKLKMVLNKFHFIIFLELGIFHVGKRVGYFVHWEPIYIGTHADPRYDERLSWEGKSDKMTQVSVAINIPNLTQQSKLHKRAHASALP